MTWRLATVHSIVSIGVALAVPCLIYLVNGALEPWMFVLGAVFGSTYWYFKIPLL